MFSSDLRQVADVVGVLVSSVHSALDSTAAIASNKLTPQAVYRSEAGLSLPSYRNNHCMPSCGNLDAFTWCLTPLGAHNFTKLLANLHQFRQSVRKFHVGLLAKCQCLWLEAARQIVDLFHDKTLHPQNLPLAASTSVLLDKVLAAPQPAQLQFKPVSLHCQGLQFLLCRLLCLIHQLCLPRLYSLSQVCHAW